MPQVTKEQLKAFLTAHADQVDMYRWANLRNHESGGCLYIGPADQEFCRTTFCVAGAICLAGGGELLVDYEGIGNAASFPGVIGPREVPTMALWLIGALSTLPEPLEDAYRVDDECYLFHMEFWPAELRRRYLDGDRLGAALEAVDQLWPVKATRPLTFSEAVDQLGAKVRALSAAFVKAFLPKGNQQ